ncbi:hypothetical protein LTR17_021112 [Elasticomyces elasticus]|nr:hypothetical protein LTR17_021112 [Elasticomyces elasticus]
MTTVIPIWLAECAMPKNRGRMMAMQLSNLIMGLIIANWVDYDRLLSYRLLLHALASRAPRYLANVGKIGEARINLAALRGNHPDTESAAMEMKEIQYAIAVEAEETGSWSDVFKDGGVSGFTRVAIAFSANFFQQL